MAGTTQKQTGTAAAALAEMADLPYFRVDADRNVIEVSPAMERLTGFRAEEVLGGSCLNLHRCEECLRGCGVFENGQVTNKCIELYRDDGSTVKVSKSGRVFFDEDGEIVGAIEVMWPLGTDVTAAAPADAGRVESERRPEPVVEPRASHTRSIDDERERIRAALERTRYRRQDAARLLDMSRTTLWRKMREYGL